MLSLILLNLIVAIFTDVYADLKETKVAEDYRTLNEVCLAVEYFKVQVTLYRNYDDLEGKAHLIWSEYQREIND